MGLESRRKVSSGVGGRAAGVTVVVAPSVGSAPLVLSRCTRSPVRPDTPPSAAAADGDDHRDGGRRLWKFQIHPVIVPWRRSIMPAAGWPSPSSPCPQGVVTRAQQQEQVRRPRTPTARHTEPHEAAGAVDAAEHTRVGNQVHPLGRRTTRQNDGLRHPGRSAERHVGSARALQATLGVGQLFPRREPVIGDGQC